MNKEAKITALENHRIVTLHPTKKAAIKDRIGVSTSTGIEILKSADIVHYEAEGNYCHIHCRNGRTIMVSKTLKIVEAALQGDAFIRVHQSHLVSLKDIAKVSSDGLSLECKKSIPVSRANKGRAQSSVGIAGQFYITLEQKLNNT